MLLYELPCLRIVIRLPGIIIWPLPLKVNTIPSACTGQCHILSFMLGHRVYLLGSFIFIM